MAEAPDWEKGLRVIQAVHNEKYENAFDQDLPLSDRYCQPRPDIDFKAISETKSQILHLTDDILQKSKSNEESVKTQSTGTYFYINILIFLLLKLILYQFLMLLQC